MDMFQNIYSAEIKLRQAAEDFFIRIWGNTRLPSHDLDHHRRVWHYAKDLVQKIEDSRRGKFTFSPDHLMLACYFHDIGMSLDPGIKHGKHGRNILQMFLSENGLDTASYKDALDAVENHDDKDYHSPANPYDLITLLSASDDMDAFGYTGIFRYIEIYLTRGVDMNILGHLIRENASKRFENLTRTYGFLDELIIKHEKRYKIIDEFFKRYNEQIADNEYVSQEHNAEFELVELIRNIIINNHRIPDILNDPLHTPEDAVVRNYLELMFAELNSTP